MKRLEKLKLHNLEEISVDEQKSIFGGGEWVIIDGQSYYQLDMVECEANAPLQWACSNEHGVIIAGFVLEGPDGSGGLFGAGQNFGNLSEDQKQALINIGASLGAFFMKIAEPILVGGENLWGPILNPDQRLNGQQISGSF